MKRFVVEQFGFVQVHAYRRFVLEFPVHFTKELAEGLLQDLQDAFPDDEGMEWTDDELGRKWRGYDIEVNDWEVYGLENIMKAPAVEGPRVINLIDVIDKMAP